MRLRLRIERNELPAVSVLWSIGDTELKQTVAQFVERVNERFPLEGESWGLEDYAVTLAGYEALHYSEVGTCFQNEDEVLIKPLQWVDSRARTMTGRNQITEDGRHLLDGIPFGRPLLKRARRPEVHIPPRKRQRAEGSSVIQSGDEDQGALVRFEELDNEDEGESEDDDDFELEVEEEYDESEDESVDEIQQQTPKVGRSTKRVKFDETQSIVPTRAAALEVPQETSSSEDSSDISGEEYSSDSSLTTSEDSSEDSSDEDSDESSESEHDEWDGIESSDPRSPTKSATPAIGRSLLKPLPNDVQSNSPKNVPPGEGDDRTRIRNARRREQRQLKHLKESGMLAPDAKLADMRDMLEKKGLTRGAALKDASRAHKRTIEAERERLLSEIAAGGVDMTKQSIAAEDECNEPPEEEPIVSAKLSVQTLHDPIATLPGRYSALNASPITTNITSPPNGIREDESAEKDSAIFLSRKRLDVAATNRLVYGMLGVRTPKTQVDKDALQKKLLHRSQRARPSRGSEELSQVVEVEEDPDSWQDKIEISAVECCDEGVTLIAPPFPFKQYWDPQYQGKKRRSGSNNPAKRRRKRGTNGTADASYVETYDKYNQDGTGDALNYDDPVDGDDEYWEEGALLEDDYEDDSEKEHSKDKESVDDGFPKLPVDISSLPNLAEADARPNDFIVYRELACSAATNWEPKMLTRTARLDTKDDEGWKVTFARRDLQPKEYDEEGNRIYSKFEMEGASDDEDDQVTSALVWRALQEPKLLQRASE